MIWTLRPWIPPILACLFVAALATAAAAQAEALVVEADEVVYDEQSRQVQATGNVRLRYRGIRLTADQAQFDLAREVVTARGHVVLTDASGRELRGEALTYDVRLELVEVQRGEGVVDGFFVRSERLRAQPRRIVAEEAMLTPCDPARPAMRITARRVELVPGEDLVASQASLWLGNRRLLTLPVYRSSLRGGEETARSFPSAGYQTRDGFWVQYPFGYRAGKLSGELTLKYGTLAGVIARNRLTYRRPTFALELTAGRNQDIERRIYDQAELALHLAERRLGPLPLFASAAVQGGWFEEQATGVRTSRTRYTVAARLPTLALGPRTSLAASASWTDGFYGTGDRYGVLRGGLGLSHELSGAEVLSFTYSLVSPSGVTPFLFDAVPADELVHRGTVLYTRTGQRGPETTTFQAGAGYDFLVSSPFVLLGYGRRLPERSHWMLTGEYNLSTTDVKLTADAGMAVGTGTYATVQVVYHTLTGAYEDVDYLLSARLCDCFEVRVKYRQVRRELWLEIGLAPRP
ncbi:MAG: hypothetical protein QN141_11525 [Armatimonadota bacterium]|nr:hypothetical protein [Armatimonadota bacterium]MDR7452006.1 hypothetical protein [Armatimonadota bacterium]MDR7467897.1 hypothetical protein [Armatimonadota bacterium]MDR7494250.1 hypothetical protein [Armatimonadota bacterium]MDR7500031.1 hypothetical protein [Armatimonadota bacterium]